MLKANYIYDKIDLIEKSLPNIKNEIKQILDFLNRIKIY